MPSNRTLLKFARDAALAAVAAAVLFVTDNIGLLNLNPAAATFVVAGVGLGYRWLRGAMGAEPID